MRGMKATASRQRATGGDELRALAEEYLTNPQHRPRTREQYSRVLFKLFLPYLAERGVVTVDEIDQRTLDEWIVHLQTNGGPRVSALSANSIDSYGRTVNHFLNWARKEHDVEGRVRAPRPDRRLLDVLERAEIKRLEDAAPETRDKLIIRILADTGIRVEELLGLRVEGSLHRVGRDHYLRVLGKGGKERDVAISPELYARIKTYVERTRPKDTSTDRIFVGLRRARYADHYGRLRPRGVQLMLKSTAIMAGIRKRVYPHLLRHSYATWQLRRGRNPISLKDDLGHRSLEMIDTVYSQLVASDRHAEYMRILRAEEDDD